VLPDSTLLVVAVLEHLFLQASSSKH
jgi:hypothetical protein